MARQTIAALAAVCGLALILLPAPMALAENAFDQVLKDYQSSGEIEQCAHSEKTLNDAQHQIPNDIQQYAPDFAAALAAALRQHAAGTCDKNSVGGTTTTAAAVGSGGSSSSGSGSSTAAPSGGKSAPAPTAKPKAGAPPAPPPVAKPAGVTLAASIAASASASKAGTSLLTILLAILGGLLLVIGLVVLVAHFMGWGLDDRWQGALQTWREAGYQSENAISEFADWARHGR